MEAPANVPEVDEFSYTDAVSKAISFLNLGSVVNEAEKTTPAEKAKAREKKEDVKSIVKFANEGDDLAKVPRDIFEQALRNMKTKRDLDDGTLIFDIDDATLMQALVRSMLEAQGITFTGDANPALNTPKKYLDKLLEDHMITRKQHYYTLWFIITQKSTPLVKQLLEENDMDMSVAVRAGLSVNDLTAGEARVAEFCLLTDLGPSAVEEEDAKKDLAGAVKKALDKMGISGLEKVIRCIRAELFPLAHDLSAIEKAIDALAMKDLNLAEAREAYMIAFFKQEASCTDDSEAKVCLEESSWRMQDAVRKRIAKALTLPAMSYVPTHDTQHPPDVQQNSIIVSLLGTVDRPAPHFTASPAVDGWFISDFLGNKHLLKGMGLSQTWLGCVKLEDIVSRYCSGEQIDIIGVPSAENSKKQQYSWDTGYMHGERLQTRRVVLDRDSLEFAMKDYTCFEEKDLLPKYLQIVDEKFHEAQQSGSSVVLLMFSHGDIDQFGNRGGLEIGFRGNEAPSKDAYLTTEKIENIHRKYPDVRLTLFMTSCYSGHWVTTPYFKNQPNITVMAAARRDEKSYSWEASNSMRHGGGKFTTGFLEELKIEPSSTALAAEAREFQEVMENLADRCEGLIMNEAMGGSLPSFTPDTTHERFHRRTGYLLHDYKLNWEALPTFPANVSMPGDRQAKRGSRTASYGPSDRYLPQSLEYLVPRYQDSNPTSTNNDHEIANMINMYIDGRLPEKEHQLILWAQITFRNAQCAEAVKLVKQLQLYKGAQIEIEAWDAMQQPGGPLAPYRRRINEIIYLLKTESGLFKPIKKDDGLVYEKPFMYVAHAMYLHQKTDGEIAGLIRKIKDLAKSEFKTGSKRVLGDKDANETIRGLMKKKKVKGLSPIKTGGGARRKAISENTFGVEAPSTPLQGSPWDDEAPWMKKE